MSQLSEDFMIDVGSDQTHERLVADIYCQGRYVGSVTEERGRGQFDFEHNWQAPGAESDVGRCPVEDFLVAVQKAAERLKNMGYRDT